MKIAVCIKQVPGTSQVEIDPVTGVLKRDGTLSKMNPYDLYALESALQLKEKYHAELTVVTMGPPQAEKVLREAFFMGVDNAVLLSDRRFGGADVLATSYTLSQGIRAAGEFDLIICGKQTTDGDTAQVGAELAEFLDIPHIAGVCTLGDIVDNKLSIVCDLPLTRESCRVALPCLISVEKGIFEPRLPSYKLKLATQDRPIKVLTLDELPDQDAAHYGLNGSPTQVKRIFPPEKSEERIVWNGPEEETTGKLFDFLAAGKYLQQLN